MADWAAVGLQLRFRSLTRAHVTNAPCCKWSASQHCSWAEGSSCCAACQGCKLLLDTDEGEMPGPMP